MSDTVIRDSDPSVEREDMLIEAQPFLKALAGIIARLNSSNPTGKTAATEDETQSDT